MKAQEIDDDVSARVEALRAARGDTVTIDEIAEVVTSIMGTMQGDVSSLDLRVYKELDSLARYIQGAKSEISALCPDDIRDEHLPAATGQLDAIVAATEDATSTILDAAEKIDAEASNLKAQAITDEVIRIYEACSFQDLTGQRISKVVATLKHIEERLDLLVSVFGDEVRAMRATAGDEAATDGKNKPTGADHDLLSGPQLPGEGNKQEEIDALLASFD